MPLMQGLKQHNAHQLGATAFLPRCCQISISPYLPKCRPQNTEQLAHTFLAHLHHSTSFYPSERKSLQINFHMYSYKPSWYLKISNYGLTVTLLFTFKIYFNRAILQCQMNFERCPKTYFKSYFLWSWNGKLIRNLVHITQTIKKLCFSVISVNG